MTPAELARSAEERPVGKFYRVSSWSGYDCERLHEAPKVYVDEAWRIGTRTIDTLPGSSVHGAPYVHLGAGENNYNGAHYFETHAEALAFMRAEAQRQVTEAEQQLARKRLVVDLINTTYGPSLPDV